MQSVVESHTIHDVFTEQGKWEGMLLVHNINVAAVARLLC
jgi:hypothetical protein